MWELYETRKAHFSHYYGNIAEENSFRKNSSGPSERPVYQGREGAAGSASGHSAPTARKHISGCRYTAHFLLPPLYPSTRVAPTSGAALQSSVTPL